jgi:hypothetical protein
MGKEKSVCYGLLWKETLALTLKLGYGVDAVTVEETQGEEISKSCPDLDKAGHRTGK